ncbi:unnamed protein product [Prunus armeniaca]|uniref:Uncharacterized protein n=1 Tax=Prunus armeniaca TaxID=36596 RepID=A0A6J5Y3I1_PRUAR|nr:unnamed protein product [Prunus armeniaca]
MPPPIWRLDEFYSQQNNKPSSEFLNLTTTTLRNFIQFWDQTIIPRNFTTTKKTVMAMMDLGRGWWLGYGLKYFRVQPHGCTIKILY